MTQVTFQPSSTTGLDTYLSSANPTYNYGASTGLLAGGTMTTLIKFSDVSTLPANARITGASLQLYEYGRGTNTYVMAMSLRKAWGKGTHNGAAATSGEANWSYAQYTGLAWTTAGAKSTASDNYGVSQSSPTDATINHYHVWNNANIISDVQQWVKGQMANNGWALYGDGTYSSFRGSAYATATMRPKLIVDYVLTYGITVNQTANGTISPASGTFDAGTSQTYTITPNAGYHITSVYVDSISQVLGNYTFSNIQANHIITANYAIDTHSVSFSTANSPHGYFSGNASQNVNYNANASAVTAIPDAHWHFDHWAISGRSDSYSNPLTVTSVLDNISVFVYFDLDSYTATYTAGAGGAVNGTWQVTGVYDWGTYGPAVTATPSTGYHFVVWSDSSTANPRQDNITYTLGLTAYFAIDVHTVWWNDWNSTNLKTESVNYGSSASPPSNPTRTGYTFTGWNNSGYGSITADTTIMALYSVNYYTVRWLDWDSSVLKSESVIYNGSGSAPSDPSRAGYTFAGWNQGATGITADRDITATYTALGPYTVQYTTMGSGSISGNTYQTIVYGGSGTQVQAIPGTGNHFQNWLDGLYDPYNPYRTDTNVTGNKSVTAVFNENLYTVNYYAGAGGSIAGTTPQSVLYGHYGSSVTATPNTGYHFTIWSDSVATASRQDLGADISVTAYFAIDIETVTFNSQGGTTVSSVNVNYNSSLGGSLPTNPTRTGYTFTGWSTSSGGPVNFTSSSVVTSSLTVYAQWTINSYTVIWKNWDITTLKTESVNYGSAASPPSNPTRTGYSFIGWDNTYSSITSPITITAHYSVNSYSVQWNNWDTNSLKLEFVNYGSAGTPPSNPTRTGYTFIGWDKGYSSITADITITAVFTSIVYTVTFDSQGGSGIAPVNTNYNTSLNGSMPINPTKNNYIFIGWWTSPGQAGTQFNSSTTVTNNLTVYAYWTLNQTLLLGAGF